MTMGVFRRLLQLSAFGGAASLGTFFWITKDDVFVPLPQSDHIFHSAHHRKFNPHLNPTTHDLCVRKVQLSQIDPSLLQSKGKLVEAFCAGVWSGWGYAFQRAYLARKYQGPDTASHLWSRRELASSTYEPGTLITDHFEVIEKDPERIIVRCGDSPRRSDVRESDGLFEISTVTKPEEGVVEFGLKSCFFRGLGKTESEPMPPHIAWLHRQYTKLLLETAISNVRR